MTPPESMIVLLCAAWLGAQVWYDLIDRAEAYYRRRRDGDRCECTCHMCGGRYPR